MHELVSPGIIVSSVNDCNNVTKAYISM